MNIEHLNKVVGNFVNKSPKGTSLIAIFTHSDCDSSGIVAQNFRPLIRGGGPVSLIAMIASISNHMNQDQISRLGDEILKVAQEIKK